MTTNRKKTYSNGESLSETLVAALIISLAMIMLFSGAKVGTDVMGKANDEYDKYYTKKNEYEEAQAAFAVEYSKITTVDPGPVEFTMDPHKFNW